MGKIISKKGKKKNETDVAGDAAVVAVVRLNMCVRHIRLCSSTSGGGRARAQHDARMRKTKIKYYL